MTKMANRGERGNTIDKRVEEYLRAPYARILMPESDGTFTAEILEFPGCLAEGDTAPEALSNLEEAARGWISAALEQGQEIPVPTTSQGFSGRVALRLPKGLHRQAVRYAERDGTSLNQFLLTAVAARVGAEDMVEKIAQRGLGAKIVRQNVSKYFWCPVTFDIDLTVAQPLSINTGTGVGVASNALGAWIIATDQLTSLSSGSTKQLGNSVSLVSERGQNRG